MYIQMIRITLFSMYLMYEDQASIILMRWVGLSSAYGSSRKSFTRKLEVDYEPAMFSPKIGMNETDAKSYKSLCVNI